MLPFRRHSSTASEQNPKPQKVPKPRNGLLSTVLSVNYHGNSIVSRSFPQNTPFQQNARDLLTAPYPQQTDNSRRESEFPFQLKTYLRTLHIPSLTILVSYQQTI